MMSVFVPERDESYDAMELIEQPLYLRFHEQTLRLYCSLAAQGNQKVAHILCRHVDEQQLLYMLSCENSAGPLRNGFYDLLIAIHLDTHATAMEGTSREYVVPLTKALHNKKNILDELDDGYPVILGPCFGLKPQVAYSDVKDK
uniref:Ryanodine receptor junctional solenoid domain-containing protein n=1 Tax=Romanomermis culicivorax TaxID=13658 RepID=A0A915IFC2_ROMCU